MATKVTTPFPVSGYLGPAYFCDRQEETQELLSALGGGRNVTLFSLRRMGKTALIRHLFHKLSTEKAYQTLYVDIMPTSDLKGFINQLATALVQTFPENTSLGKKMWQWIKSLRPQVSFDPFSGLPQLSLDMVRAEEQQATIRSLFNFLDDSGKKSVIAIDEFQQITRYPEISTEAWLRSEIQSLKNVNFIFCGSQKHLLLEMFNSAKRPFYASTQMLPISTIGKDAYAKFITNHFKKSGTTIDAVEVDYILDWTRQHTFYVQSICNRLYQVGSRKITKEAIQSVIEKIFQENEAVYFTFRELLTGPQWALLKAIAKEGRVFAPTAMAFIQQYDLGSPATVKRSLESLLDKEMIFRESDIEGSYLQVYDLFLSRWLEYNQ
ncbi:MAG TPA: ATP-binding protein [Cyclobacteriaceae bacterium]|nr:ATP-binding protein [Cyclobacteriaceae bacterium]